MTASIPVGAALRAPGPGERLFHLIAPDDARAALARGDATWSPASVGVQGFVHLSFAPQLAGTLAAHFVGADPLWLVEIELADTELSEKGLRVELSRGGALFPHLYRPLQWSELARAWRLVWNEKGWSLPHLGTTPALDEPPGGPFPPGKGEC